MLIVADENIPYAQAVFAEFGEVRLVKGRTLTAAQVREADVLLVRAVTVVDAALLGDSRVQFVGTATIGFNHVDVDFLRGRSIGFARAAGCNATAAAEYVVSALVVYAVMQGVNLRDKSVAIIGCGNVGQRLYAKLSALGVHCLRHDPPLAAAGGEGFVDWEAVYAADIVTIHTPLTVSGEYATVGLLNAQRLARLREEVLLVNAARGEVVDEGALLALLAQRPRMQVILDVWGNEPVINQVLLARALLGTPHIAGYSVEGKLNGTRMLYQALCAHLGRKPTFDFNQPEYLPLPALTHLRFSPTAKAEEVVCHAVLASYDPRRDDAALRGLLMRESPAVYFDYLRKTYPLRREFSSVTLELPNNLGYLAESLRGVGFSVVKTC